MAPVEARPAHEVTLIAIEHYPFSCECDVSEDTRQLCFEQVMATDEI